MNMVNDMNDRSSIILNVHSKEDLKQLENNNAIEYINLDLSNIDREIIAYFIENGQKYFYSDITMDKKGYHYVDHKTFTEGENVITKIITKMPEGLSTLEKSRYLYIQIGTILSYDINILPEKNDQFDYYRMNSLNNIWNALSKGKAINHSVVKIYFYLCVRCGISCEIQTINSYEYKLNQITIENQESFLTDLTKDIPNIQAHFKTKYFTHYNDDSNMDKKIGYIKEEYNDILLDALLKKMSYKDENILGNILYTSQNVLDIRNIKPIELSSLLTNIFQKYFPGNQITINNLYLNDIYKNKEHFLLLSDNKRFYSFNYRSNSFWEISKEELEKEIESNRIGIYLNETIPQIGKKRTNGILL